MKSYIVILISVLIFTELSYSQVNSRVQTLFKEKTPNWLIEYNVPAVGVGIIENGEIKYVKVFGELQKGVPAPDNTIFNVASITKTVISMLTLKLVNAGQWSLDEPLSSYWIDPDVINDSLHKKLTTRHVLTHQTGFVNWRWNHPTKKLAFDFEPGTKYQYSGEGFEYLRHALERKFNKSIDYLTDSLLLKPLQMQNTSQSWNKGIDQSKFAAWHDADGKKYTFSYRTKVSAADDLLTTVEDYCKFGVYLLNGADLSETLFKDMVTPQSNIQEYTALGLGWFIVKDLPDGEYAIHHGGSDYGVKTMALFLPESKRGIVVFTNGDNGMAVYNQIIKETFDIGDKIVENLYYRPNIPKTVKVSTKMIENYLGSYKHPDGRQNIISKQGSEIIITGGGWPRTTLYPQAENKFFVKEFDVQVEFIGGKTGKTNKMIIYQDGKKYAETERVE